MSDFFKLVQRLNQIEDNTDSQSVVENAPLETGSLKAETAATASLLTKFNAIQEANPYQEVVAEAEETEVEETMQDRFAKFMKAERETGTDIDSMKQVIDEATAEYEYADRAFGKMADLINTMEKMVQPGSMLERKIKEAGGEPIALNDLAEALAVAYDALERAHYDALGNTPEQMPED